MRAVPAVVEIKRLEDLVTWDNPPCDAMIHAQPCPNRSAYRVHSVCEICNHECTRYLCTSCYRSLRNGLVVCGLCLTVLGDWQTLV